MTINKTPASFKKGAFLRVLITDSLTKKRYNEKKESKYGGIFMVYEELMMDASTLLKFELFRKMMFIGRPIIQLLN